jgi:hypothetical protein
VDQVGDSSLALGQPLLLPTSFWTAFDSALAEAADTGTKQEVWWEDVDRLQCEALELEAQQFSPNTSR